MKVRYKTIFSDHIRTIIGDREKLIFTEDELEGIIEKHTGNVLINATISAYNSKYKLCCMDVKDISLVSGYDANGVYLIDEVAGTILFDASDPLNTGTAPADGDTMIISYYDVDRCNLVSELFQIMSSNAAKLSVAQSCGGLSMSLQQLSDNFWKESCKWACEGSNCG